MRQVVALVAAAAYLLVPATPQALEASECLAQLERTAQVLPRLEPQRGARPEAQPDGWCHLDSANDVTRGGFYFPVRWRYYEAAEGMRFDLELGPWAPQNGAKDLYAVLSLSQAAGSDLILLEDAWAGWDADNALVLGGEIYGVRRDTRAGRQMARGSVRMRAADLTVRSRAGFVEWLAETHAGQRDVRLIVNSLAGLPLTDAARGRLAEWAEAREETRSNLSLQITHPNGANVIAIWNYLLFKEVDRYGHLGAALEGLQIDVTDNDREAAE